MNGNKNSPWSASDHGDSIVFCCCCCSDHVMITVRNRTKFEKKTPEKWFDVAKKFNIFIFARIGCLSCHMPLGIRIVLIPDWHLRCKFFTIDKSVFF